MMELTVSDVHKAYGGTPVLHGVTLNVAPGSLTAIVGASGAGKTTLLRIIAGFEGADTGVVTLGAQQVDDGRRRVAPEKRHIGYVPQDGALFPHLTVRGNVAFGLRHGERRSARIAELLSLVGLSGYADRYPHELSGGQQQRVAIARALATRPRLVLLDEPFAALDAGLRASVRADVLGALRTVGATGVLVTHDQDEALSVADYVAVLRDGVITQSAPPRTVYTTPADPWTASFLGTANLLPGALAAAPSGLPGVRTALGWHELRKTGEISDGPGEVIVLIRPEQVALEPSAPSAQSAPSGSSAPSGARGRITGQVTEVRYHGHDALITVEVEEAGQLRIRTAGSEPPAAGDEVALAVRGQVTAWPAPEGTG